MMTVFPVDEYIQVSKEKYGYNAEQALGMLFWHKHDLDRAMQDLANFTPFPDEWTVEDKVHAIWRLRNAEVWSVDFFLNFFQILSSLVSYLFLNFFEILTSLVSSVS